MSKIIKIRKKEEPFEALMWSGENEQDLRVFSFGKCHIVNDINNRIHIYLGESPIPAYSLSMGEYLYKTHKGQIGKITQEIIDRSWEVVKEDEWIELKHSISPHYPRQKVLCKGDEGEIAYGNLVYDLHQGYYCKNDYLTEELDYPNNLLLPYVTHYKLIQ